MSVHIIIPARLESTRLPRKLLLDETGKPLIQHTIENAVNSEFDVDVVTDSVQIRNIADDVNVMSWMSGEFKSGTDRVASVVTMKWLTGVSNEDVVCNLQADEPEISPGHIGALVESFKSFPGCDMATLATQATVDDQKDSNVVKVRRGVGGYATHFSRDVLSNSYRHIGVYAYSARFLRWFASQPQTEREKELSLEQMRALDKGCRIRVVIVDHPFRGIDTRKDYDEFVKRHMAAAEHERW